MASTRKFGVCTAVSGLTAGMIVNSLRRNKTVQTAEARDQKGRIIDRAAYSQNETISIDGLTVGDGVAPGIAVHIGDKNYLITSSEENEANTDFVKQSCEAQTADIDGYIWPLSATSGDDAVPVSGELP